MDNIRRVTVHITESLKREGIGDPERRTLTVILTKNGKPWFKDSQGSWWRTYLYIKDSVSIDTVENREQALQLGKAVGKFHIQLEDLPPPRVYETIRDFHNMESRYRHLYAALKKDPLNRVQDVRDEIQFLLQNEERGSTISRFLRLGILPERICHNDTKANNILFDRDTGSVLCVIDLDTVMPGTVLYDIGDLIRTVSTSAPEDEQDLSVVRFVPEFYNALLEGYVSESNDFLQESEWDLLIEAGRSTTQIMALRFLTDYIEGDHYYKTRYTHHNLDRTRNQISLIRSMDVQWPDIQSITNTFIKRK